MLNRPVGGSERRADGGLETAGGRLEAGVAAGGQVRWAAADLSGPVEEARRRLDLSPVAAAALGRALTGAVLLLRLAAKVPTRLVLEIRGDGPLRSVIAEVDAEGNLRGTVGRPRAAVPHRGSGKLAVGRAVGRGRLRVLRQIGGGSYNSEVELVTGEIGDDLAHYLRQSEQVDSAVLLGVLAKPRGVAAAGGAIVQALPGAEEAALARVEANIEAMAGVSRVLERRGVAGLAAGLLGGLGAETLERRSLVYRCRCSRARLRRQLSLLPAADLEHLGGGRSGEDEVAVECVFCGSRYTFSAAELDASAGEAPTASG